MSSSEAEGNKAQDAVEIFALAYLYVEESKQREKEAMLDSQRARTHHSQSGVLPHPVSITVRELCNKLPYSINSENLTAEDVYSYMDSRWHGGLLERVHRTHTGEYAAYSITANGMLVIKRVLGKLSQGIQDNKIKEQDIDRVEGDSRAKIYLKGLWSKLVDKSQDEIVETLISSIRTQGVSLALLLIGLAG